jgi:hypothetical protein
VEFMPGIRLIEDYLINDLKQNANWLISSFVLCELIIHVL